MSNRRPIKKNKNPIIVKVHYPTTEEGKRELSMSYSSVVFDILENKFGSDGLDVIMEAYKEKHKNK